MSRPLRILLDARLVPGQRGGVEQVVLGLMHAFAAHGGPHEYIFLCYDGAESWLGRYLGGGVRLHAAGSAPRSHVAASQRLRTLVPALKALRRLWRPLSAEVPPEPKAVADIAPDVIHFNLQTAFRTSRANLYQPWDLQHVHYPEHFARDDWLKRDHCYRFFCNQATRVLMTSEWGCADVQRQYGIPAQRTCRVTMAPPVAAYPDVTDADADAELARLGIAQPFALYPAQTWPHKNHATLIDALRLARDRHSRQLTLVCTGKLTDHHAVLVRQIDAAGLADQVRFLGFTSETTLLALYRRARLIAFPSLFEGWGLPVTEAMTLGVPVVASRATCLPEQVGDAAVLVDPSSPGELASAILRVWDDDGLRRDLGQRGRQRAASFTWERTARELIALYEELAPP